MCRRSPPSLQLLLALGLLWAASGCSTGNVDPAQECGPNGECPDTFTCDPISRRCVKGGNQDIDASPMVTGSELTVSIVGGGSVVVSGAPGPCTIGTCKFNFTTGTSVTLTAQPSTGARFVSWSGACSGENPSVMVTMDAARACIATFAGRVTVTGEVSGATGAVTARSSDPTASCSGSTCSIDPGGNVTLAAPTLEGFRFTSWSGEGCSGTAPVLQLTAVTANMTCTATYTQGLAVIGSIVGTTGNVTATSTSQGAVCAAGGCTIGPGATVTLTAPNMEGYRFVGWSGDPECTGVALVLTLANVTHSISCSAGYVQRFTVSAMTTGGVTVPVKVTSTDANATCAGSTCTVDARGRVALEAQAATGFRFSGWGGGCTGSDNPLLLTNIGADRICTAAYVKRVTVSGTVTGGPTAPVVAVSTDMAATCAGATCSVDAPGKVTLTAPDATGYRFAGWSGTAACTGGANPLVLDGVTGDQACVAAFVARVTVGGVVVGGPGAVVATSTDLKSDCGAGSSCKVDVPGTVTLTAPPPTDGYAFRGWTGLGCSSGSLALEIKKTSVDVTCTATYAKRVTMAVSLLGPTSAAVSISSNSEFGDCTVTECTVDAGDVVTLKVTGGDFQRFVGWNGAACVGTGLVKDLDMTLTADGACEATFVDSRTTARPSIVSRWRNPTGWLDEKLQKIALNLRLVNLARYECRTGRTLVDGPSNVSQQKWGPCDLADGGTPLAYGVPVVGDVNGSYRTEIRLAIVEYRSESTSYDYYAHDSLDGAVPCPEAATDAELTSLANQLELNAAFAFGENDIAANPFVRLTLTYAFYNQYAWPGTPFLPSTYSFDVLSLRHRFTFLSQGANPNRYLAVRRQYESSRMREFRNQSSCANSYDFGWKRRTKFIAGNPAQARIPCVALLMNARGSGYCVARSANGLYGAVYSATLWEKLLQKDSFSRKNRTGCTGSSCGQYLPD